VISTVTFLLHGVYVLHFPIVWILLLLLASAPTPSAPHSPSDKERLLSLERLFREEPDKVTISDLDALLADQYQDKDSSGGILDKQQALERFKAAKERGASVPPAVLSDLTVSIEGNTGKVSGNYKIHITADSQHSFTDTFIRTQQTWKLFRSVEGTDR
jgi:hypothetical protein